MPPIGPAPGCDEPRKGLLAWLRHAFAIEKYDESSLEEAEKEALQRLAVRIHAKRLTTAAILWLQSNRHMNMLGSSAMIAAQPMFELTHPVLNGILRHIGLNVPPEDYQPLYAAFEKRYSVEYLVQELESLLSAADPPSPA